MPGMPQGMSQGMPQGMPPFFPPNFMSQNNRNLENGMEQHEPRRMPFIEQKESPEPSPKMPSPSLDVDDLVRKIDAKIAALEEEEKKQQKKEQQAEKTANTEVIGDKDSELFHKAADVDAKLEKEPKEKIDNRRRRRR